MKFYFKIYLDLNIQFGENKVNVMIIQWYMYITNNS